MVLLVDKRTRVVFYMFTVGNKQAKIEELSTKSKKGTPNQYASLLMHQPCLSPKPCTVSAPTLAISVLSPSELH